MQPNDIQTLYDYHYWATRRILDTVEHVSDEQFHLTELGHSPGDLDLIVYLRQR